VGTDRSAAAEAALELADEAYARLDVDRVIAHLSVAVREFTDAGDRRRAGLACARLGHTMGLLAHFTAAKAWFARAERMVADLEPCIEQGWIALSQMGCEVDDTGELLRRAELALDRARRFGDLELETKALADGGLAHVQAGRIDDGMAMLDEAMALACGPTVAAPDTPKSVCSFFTACYYAADFERFESWSRLLRQHGLVGAAPAGPAYLSSHCDSLQAYLLIELGRWTEAEAVLVRAGDEVQARLGVPSWHPAIALADLRTLQGRWLDAEALLVGKDQTPQAQLPAARVHLARGDLVLAASTARRGLRTLGATDRLRAAELLAVLVEAALGAGDLEAARGALDDLQRRVAEVDLPVLRARAAACTALLAGTNGDAPTAVQAVASARAELEGSVHRWRAAVLAVDLARWHEAAGDRRAAEAAARTAAHEAGALDIMLADRDRELLARLADGRGTSTGGRTAGTEPAVLRCAGDWWEAAHGGTRARVRASKGLRYVAELLRSPGCERHVLDLVDRVEGVGDVDRRALGDAGPMLDGPARTAYRHRIEALRSAIDDATLGGRLDEAERLQEEHDTLLAQLASAFGLGGRGRAAASAAERARLNVTRAIRTAVAGLDHALPGAGAALDRRIRTGTYCAYEPVDGDVRWVLGR
jgi:hypothetical protein